MGTLLLCGAFFGTLTASQSFYISDIPLPFSIDNAQAVYHNETSTIYLFGGGNSDFCNPFVYKRDVGNTTNMWNQTQISTPISCFASATQRAVRYENLLYFSGIGNGIQGYHNELFDFTHQTFENSSVAPYFFNQYIGGGPCVSTNGTHIFIIGGYPNDTSTIYTNIIQILNLNTKSWSYHPIDLAFSHQGCAMVNNQIFVFGGATNIYTNINTIYKYSALSTEWTLIGNMSVPSINGHAIYSSIYNKIYYVGANMVFVFDIDKEKIIHKELLPVPACQSPVLIVNNILMILGGKLCIREYDQQFQYTPLVQIAKLPIIEPTSSPTVHPVSTPLPTTNITSNDKDVKLSKAWFIFACIMIVLIVVICSVISYQIGIRKGKDRNIGDVNEMLIQHEEYENTPMQLNSEVVVVDDSDNEFSIHSQGQRIHE